MTQAAFHKTTPVTVTEECVSAPLPAPDPVTGIIPYNSLAAFGIRQTGQLELCDGKRALAADSDRIHNEYVDRLLAANEALERSRRPWYQRIF